jgi:hypothetical protein
VSERFRQNSTLEASVDGNMRMITISNIKTLSYTDRSLFLRLTITGPSALSIPPVPIPFQ